MVRFIGRFEKLCRHRCSQVHFVNRCLTFLPLLRPAAKANGKSRNQSCPNSYFTVSCLSKLSEVRYKVFSLFSCIFLACLEPLGLENFQVPDASIAVTSERKSKDRIRLGYYKAGMWCAYHIDLNQFVKVTSLPSLIFIFRFTFGEIH